MKKTLLMAAATLAAGIISTQATGVYSQNIVGYVNLSFNSGYTLAVNPLNTGVTNGLTEIFNVTNLPDDCVFLTWNGSGYNTYNYVPEFAGPDGNPWQDANGNEVGTPSLPPGTAFFFQNPGAKTNFTLVGTVVPSVGATNAYSLVPGYSLTGSGLPVAGSLTNSIFNLPLVDDAVILLWAGSGYATYNYVPEFAGADGNPWQDASGNEVAPPTVTVGQGFFYQNPGASVTWSQTLPSN
jgi:hypothetical protein